ncbi:MAG: TrkA family potassium uptake protein [Anaerolineaceae bacterium]|nr:TrkA family potassium uptake protein [Anaerolineaceae bacterium]
MSTGIQSNQSGKNILRHQMRAQLHDARVLLNEFWKTLALFLSILLGGGLILHLWYIFPGTENHPGFIESLYSAFAMLFFANELPFPEQPGLQFLFFLIPILGLSTLAEGLVRFSIALTDKRARGEKWQVAMASTYKNHIIVCGFGKVGYRVTQELLKFDREVIAIENNPQGRFVEKAKEMGVPVIIANALRSTNLIKANVAQADAIIPCTANELTNLDIALDARELNPDIKVVMRMFNDDLARRIEKGFGIHTAFSTSALTAPLVAAKAMRINVKHSFYVGDTLLNISELEIKPGSRLAGKSIQQLEKAHEISIVYVQDEEKEHLHPAPELVLPSGARVLLLASIDTLRKLKNLNQGG